MVTGRGSAERRPPGRIRAHPPGRSPAQLRPGAVPRSGFTLAEALIAITISTFVVIMAANVFLVQNDFYSFLLQRTRVQENARAVLEVVGSEIQAVTVGGLVEAESDGMIYRTPQTMAAVCAVAGSDAFVHFSRVETLEPSKADGIGALDRANDEWVFGSTNVAGAVQDVGQTSALPCALAGADTVGMSGSFARLPNLIGTTGLAPQVGDVLMVYEEVELLIDTSTLDPNLLALYRGPAGGALTEYATGLADSARFQYWTPMGQGMWRNRLGTGLLDRAERIRIVAATHQPAESGAGSDADFSLRLDLPLKNR